MGWIRKFIYFTVLVDREEIAGLSSYDRSLIYGSFVRQTLGAAFVFLVFLYACSTIMPLWGAAVIAVVLASIIFFIDQAIVGSEWTLHREFSPHWFINGPVGFAVKILQLLPRIAYAIAVAWIIASLAEIALQSRAIDRVLNERTRSANTEYYKRTDDLAREHRDVISKIDSKISTLEATIITRSDPSANQTIALLETQVNASADSINTLSSRIRDLREQEQQEQTNIADLQSNINSLSGQIAAIKKSMEEEIKNPNRCKSPGSEFCKGLRWNDLNDSLITNEDMLGKLEADLSAANEQFVLIQQALLSTETEVKTARFQAEEAAGKLQQTLRTTTSVGDLKNELTELLANRVTLLEEQKKEREELEATLISTGNRDFADYGPLDRRIGLQFLHDHPVYGAVARQFSWELKTIIILFELSPVLVTVFFAPFSFLSLRMRQKREAALNDAAHQQRQRDAEDTLSKANHEVEMHSVQTDAAAKMGKYSREAGLTEAMERDAYEDEMLALDKKDLKRKQDLSDHKKETGPESYGDDEAFQQIERERRLEELRQQLLQERRKTALYARAVERETRNHTDGEER